MTTRFPHRKISLCRRVLAMTVLTTFLSTSILPAARAQEIFLPVPGTMVHLSSAFAPPMLKGIKVYPENPFLFDFILDKGESKTSANDETAKLVKYFLASLTTPEKDMWVNLSPYEKDRIVPESFGQTEMGRDLLAQDYLLKQITASLIYPEDELGKRFWDRVTAEAKKKFGTTEIPMNTFNKVWIVPAKAVVYENPQSASAYVLESSLKVMLEEDYVAMSNQKDMAESRATARDVAQSDKDANVVGSQIVREIVIPALTKEVNEGKNFAQLRQVYNSLILAAWYRKKIKDSILSQVYVDKNKVAGVNIEDPQQKQKIYEQYLEAFKKGAYNYIKEESDPITQEMIPRKYFSGGFSAQNFSASSAIEIVTNPKELWASVPIEEGRDEIVRVQVASAAVISKLNAARIAKSEDRFSYSNILPIPDEEKTTPSKPRRPLLLEGFYEMGYLLRDVTSVRPADFRALYDELKFKYDRFRLDQKQREVMPQTREAKMLLLRAKKVLINSEVFPQEVKKFVRNLSIRIVENGDTYGQIRLDKQVIAIDFNFYESMTDEERYFVIGHEIFHLFFGLRGQSVAQDGEIEVRCDIGGFFVARLLAGRVHAKPIAEALRLGRTLPLAYDELYSKAKAMGVYNPYNPHPADEIRFSVWERVNQLSNRQLVELINLPIDQTVQSIVVAPAAETASASSSVTDQNVNDVWNRIQDEVILYHGTSINSLENIRQFGLRNEEKPFEMADINEYERLHLKALGSEVPLRADTGVVHLTTKPETAQSFAREGSEVLRMMLERIPGIVDSGKLDDSERANLIRIRDKYSVYMQQHAEYVTTHPPIVLGIKGSALRNGNVTALQSEANFLAGFRNAEKRASDGGMALSIDYYLELVLLGMKDVRVGYVNADEITFPSELEGDSKPVNASSALEEKPGWKWAAVVSALSAAGLGWWYLSSDEQPKESPLVAAARAQEKARVAEFWNRLPKESVETSKPTLITPVPSVKALDNVSAWSKLPDAEQKKLLAVMKKNLLRRTLIAFKSGNPQFPYEKILDDLRLQIGKDYVDSMAEIEEIIRMRTALGNMFNPPGYVSAGDYAGRRVALQRYLNSQQNEQADFGGFNELKFAVDFLKSIKGETIEQAEARIANLQQQANSILQKNGFGQWSSFSPAQQGLIMSLIETKREDLIPVIAAGGAERYFYIKDQNILRMDIDKMPPEVLTALTKTNLDDLNKVLSNMDQWITNNLAATQGQVIAFMPTIKTVADVLNLLKSGKSFDEAMNTILDREVFNKPSQVVSPGDSPRASSQVVAPETKGGIDFNKDKLNLKTRSNGGEIKFQMDPAQLLELQNAPGFTPIIINVQPMTNLQMFLGLKEDDSMSVAAAGRS